MVESFISLHSFMMPKGKMFVVENNRDRCRESFKQLLNTWVEIDKKSYFCLGVESHAIPFIREGTKIGLLVDCKKDGM